MRRLKACRRSMGMMQFYAVSCWRKRQSRRPPESAAESPPVVGETSDDAPAMSSASCAMSEREATAAAPPLGPRRQARSTKSQCSWLASPRAGGPRPGPEWNRLRHRQASRSSMPVPGFRFCTMQKERFVGPIRLPSYAIQLTVLICNEPCDIADRLAIALPLCLKLSLQIVGASGERRVGGNIRVPFREQLCESLLNTSPCRLFT